MFSVCVQVEALRRVDHPPKESYRLSLIKKLRKLSPVLQKREQAPKCGSIEEGNSEKIMSVAMPCYQNAELTHNNIWQS
jgi:hypothetical protein